MKMVLELVSKLNASAFNVHRCYNITSLQQPPDSMLRMRIRYKLDSSCPSDLGKLKKFKISGTWGFEGTLLDISLLSIRQ